jgi:hypothetical protein
VHDDNGAVAAQDLAVGRKRLHRRLVHVAQLGHEGFVPGDLGAVLELQLDARGRQLRVRCLDEHVVHVGLSVCAGCCLGQRCACLGLVDKEVSDGASNRFRRDKRAWTWLGMRRGDIVSSGVG